MAENNSIREVSVQTIRYKVIYSKGDSIVNSVFFVEINSEGKVMIDTKHPVDPAMVVEALEKINEDRN